MKSIEYVLVVNKASQSVMESIAQLRKFPQYAHIRPLVMTANPAKYSHLLEIAEPVEIIGCSFGSDKEIALALQPFKKRIRAVVCRSDTQIQYLRRLTPHLPPGVLVATPKSLEIATNKRLMREVFARHAPEITPHFIQVHDASPATVAAVEDELQYPVIVKPANLASSLLITACQTRAELQAALGKIFSMIDEVYKRKDRKDKPQVIVEEYLEGDFYSVDAFVMEPGQVYCCPPIGYVPAKQLGIDDFFLYKRFAPTRLTDEEMAEGNKTVAKALAAVGLTNSPAHVELVLTKHGWKIIELGPRLGWFRHQMYKSAYGIDHSMNDILIHLGQKPIIPTKIISHCSAYSIYPEKEGTLHEIQGLQDVKMSPMTLLMRVFAKSGDICVHAKNGGRALAEFVIADDNEAAFERMVDFVEHKVKAIIE